MNVDTLVNIENVSKKFCKNLKRGMLYGSLDVTRSMFGIPYDQGYLRKNEFWAISDMSLKLGYGEGLGIVGENGSGKSTLLRLISGIFPPDKGRIEVRGRVSSLIAVGAGFHPYMTGRENIYLNGTMLGMTRNDILHKYESIVDYAELRDFIESPVSIYSAGMIIRLGFSIAIHCNPDILIIDDILSVGDQKFREKCIKYLNNIKEKLKGIIFVSHNLDLVRSICSRAIIMHKGSILFNGRTNEALTLYENSQFAL
jgi:lipopolysaccharide transport system ATP-binding protein